MRRYFVGTLALALLACAATHAQMQLTAINIWPGVAPGSEHSTQVEQTIRNTPIGTVVLDVVTPTLTAYLPEKSKATGTGVIVAPGGACIALAMDVEAYDIARRLQSRGIAAFVLKYRIIEKKGQGIPKNLDMDQACKNGMADGIQAVKVVRRHAAQWGVSPAKIGFMGFSAGGQIASGALLQPDIADRPNFAAFIYGAPFGVMPAIPADLPPVFMAWAQDDPYDAIPKFYDALRAAGNKPEAHIFASGGHGFGLKKQGTTSDHWIDDFENWLKSHAYSG
ncbi:MAG: alpha/beta hydrolase [Candidatus Eremiobacteraeota bacterium]|nr:alpha/beta hydrolase [Candidatus Eremiobacteraeota bacterium]